MQRQTVVPDPVRPGRRRGRLHEPDATPFECTSGMQHLSGPLAHVPEYAPGSSLRFRANPGKPTIYPAPSSFRRSFPATTPALASTVAVRTHRVKPAQRRDIFPSLVTKQETREQAAV